MLEDPRKKRIRTLQAAMLKHGLDYVALVPGPNLYYFTGLDMHLSERVTLALIPSRGRAGILMPGLEVPNARTRVRILCKFFPWSDAEGVQAAWLAAVKSMPLAGKRIAVEYEVMRVLEWSQLRAAARGSKLQDMGPLVATLRMIKDAEEVEAMQRAARVLEESLNQVLSETRPGLTERDLAARWQLAMRQCGADRIPDQPIVAGGPNSANPHTTVTDRPLEQGDFVIFDGWCPVDGYYGDITRTIVLGHASDEQRRLYAAVLAANEAGRRAGAPGVRCQQVDRAAREEIARAGYEKYFLHRTGHGLGLEVHEPPFMVEGDTTRLEPGMTYTVEPGIYVAGQGGVRIEDDVVVTQGGAKTLTTMTRELLELD